MNAANCLRATMTPFAQTRLVRLPANVKQDGLGMVTAAVPILTNAARSRLWIAKVETTGIPTAQCLGELVVLKPALI